MPDIRNRAADLIYGKGIVTAESIASELRRRLARDLTTSFLTEWQLVERARNILSEFEPILAESLLNTDLAAWIAGFDQVRNKLPEWAQDAYQQWNSFQPPPPTWRGTSLTPGDEPVIRFPLLERAAENIFERKIVTRAEFDTLTNEAKQRAFTVAGDMTEKTIEKIRDTLHETLVEGPSLEGFKSRLGPALESSFIGPGHLENVFRTNTQAAFSDGHNAIADDSIVREMFPYQAWLAIHDARTEDTHLRLEKSGLDGTNVYRRDDPFWDVFDTPLRWNCRCGKNLMTIEAAARAGVREAQQWLATGNKPLVSESRLPYVLTFLQPEPGFEPRRSVAA